LIRRAAIVAAGALLAAVLLAGFVSYRIFLRHVPAVLQRVASLDACEAQVAAEREGTLRSLAGQSLRRVVARGAIADFAPHDGGGNIDWNLRYGIWFYLLPWSLSAADVAALYAHYLPLQGGNGLCFGAQAYFSKAAQSLTDEELAELVVVARAPRLYSSSEGRLRAREEAAALLRGGG
jgi:hypothetical protein